MYKRQVANYDPSDPIEVSYTKNFPGEPTGKDNPELLYKDVYKRQGHYVPEELMRKDFTLMKQNNINSVRLCHYPQDRKRCV